MIVKKMIAQKPELQDLLKELTQFDAELEFWMRALSGNLVRIIQGALKNYMVVIIEENDIKVWACYSVGKDGRQFHPVEEIPPWLSKKDQMGVS